MVKIIRNQIW